MDNIEGNQIRWEVIHAFIESDAFHFTLIAVFLFLVVLSQTQDKSHNVETYRSFSTGIVER